MVDVVVSSEELEVARTEEERMRRKRKDEEREEEEEEDRGEESSEFKDGLVRWENLLPKTVLRVLLVEADDSTRQIIAALLRKCSYRVAAVSDGLKAWEVLRGRPHDIDLILTEVELPSISGYALLTLIMEHDVCKNIPVIMMSSQDSVSTVYKCMLRGAADYLVKPIRRNELRNLWQHVWRRQSSLGGSFPLDGSTRQDKAEGTSENNAASSNASGDVGGIKRSKEYVEKGSDAQSSCTKPEMEAESVQVEDAQDLEQPLRGEIPNGKDFQMREKHTSTGQQSRMHENNPGGSSAAAYTSSFVMVGDNAEAEDQRLKDIEANEAHDNNVTGNYSIEAIDFMGTSNYESSSNNANCKLQSSFHLDLTLRGSHFGGFDNQMVEERNMLRHSSASAFTRYSSKGLQPFFPALSTIHQTEPGATSDARMTTNNGAQMSSTLGQTPSTQRSFFSHDTGQTKESEPTSCLQQRVIPIQAPLEGMTFDKLCSSYGSVFPPMFCKQSSASPTPSSSSAGQRESTPRASGYHYSNFENNSSYMHHCRSLNTNDSTNQKSHKEQEFRFETPEDNGHISPATDQSASSSFCNGALTRINSMGHGSACGSNSNLDQVAPGRAAAESKTEENFFGLNPNCHRSIQREAALTKFRLKRKDRCYDKKVRYESRKKLAEQRPRVKGQFVRQLQVDPPHAETN